MRFHCLMVLRDEQDIIVQNLRHLLSWADGVYVLDTGSTDGTWELVNEMAREDKRIVPFKQEPLVFNDGLRGLVFHQFRNRFDPGDWVLRTDCDEFYHIAPPQFVAERLRRGETAVWLQWYYFRLRQREVEDYETGRVDVMQDRQRPIEERRRYYKISQYPEPRMFRYRRAMAWPEFESFPYHAGFVAQERIPVRHYPHRDPLQMQARFDLRAKITVRSPFKHWKLHDWRDELVDDQGKSKSEVGPKRGLAGESGIDTGPLLFWPPGNALKEERLYYTSKTIPRLVQRIIHPMLLPILDPRRRGWNPEFKPLVLSAGVPAKNRRI
jgi:glycosyltransferase involved in cell wall biosynthesis